jgi:hypothetical protein
LIIKGEYEHALRMLERCAPYMDQMVVIHDGSCSDDGFVDSCKRLGCIYYEVPDSRAMPDMHRGVAMALTYTDWCFVVDSDEMPTVELLEGMKDYVNGTSLVGYRVHVHRTERDKVVQEYSHLRLLRILPDVTWSRLAHSGVINLVGGQVGALPESMLLLHEHEPTAMAIRSERNVGFIEHMIQRWSNIPQVVVHCNNIAKGNPAAQKLLHRMLGGVV